MNLCYLQARGGSKRFPMKALALWNGIPMLGDAIQKAQATGLFDYILVSSDSPEILQVAHDYGAMPLWRTAEASSDTATDDDVAREVLAYFPKVLDVCKLYPCVPLLDPKDMIQAHDWLWYKFGKSRGLYSVDSNGKDAGAFYFFDAGTARQINTIKLDKFPWGKYFLKECQDINTPEDLEIAKQKAGK